MAQNGKLYRNFIILNEDEGGYSNSKDKTLSGYSKIQSKGELCKISFYVQNLKTDVGSYSMFLICDKKDGKSLVDIGELKFNDLGKGETIKEWNAENIADIGISYDKILGTAVANTKDGITVFVMCGFMNGKEPTDNWKKYKVVKGKDSLKAIGGNAKKSESTSSKKHKEVIEEKKVKETEFIKEVEVIEEKVVEEKKEKIKRDDEFEDAEYVNIKSNEKADSDSFIESRIKEKMKKKMEDDSEVKVESAEVDFEEYESKIEERKIDEEDFAIRGSIGEYFENIAEGFEVYRNKIKDIKHCKWYKVEVSDLYQMCNMSNYNKYTVAYYPMLNYYPYIKKHGHFMLGYKCDKDGNLKYIVYGIPGKKDKDEQPYEGKTGFVTWVSEKEDSNEGLWLMFYDYKNSTIVVPMQ